MNRPADHAPDFHGLARAERPVGPLGMGRLQYPPTSMVATHAAQNERALDHRHHQTTGTGRRGPIHHQQIPIMNPVLGQIVPGRPHQERALGTANQMRVQAQTALDVIVSGGGEAGRHRSGQQRPAGGGVRRPVERDGGLEAQPRGRRPMQLAGAHNGRPYV